MPTNFAVSSVDCLKSVENFGYTSVKNICDGTEAIVQWGSMDWFAVLIMVGVVLLLSVVFVLIYLDHRG